MSKIRLVVETSTPAAPPAGYARMYIKDDRVCYQLDDGAEHQIADPMQLLDDHVNQANPHPGYLTQAEADLLYAAIEHLHATANKYVVSKTPQLGEFATVKAAIDAALALSPSTTNRFLIKIGPGIFTEDPDFTVPSYVYLLSDDPWAATVIKTSDLTNDFMIISPNTGVFNVGVSGPTTAGKSAIRQLAGGTTKLYWVSIKEGYYGVTLNPASGTARCHCIGVVTDGPTQMNRLFNCDNPAGVGVFILMQSGPMSTTWVGTQPAALYLNGNGSLSPPKANATVDLCQFRGSGHDSIYVDNGALVRGISVSFAGGTNAIHIGPNGTSKVDLAGSQIKPGAYTKDILCESPLASISFSGVGTESKMDIATGATFVANFADTSPEINGQVLFGELWIGNKNVKTPLATYIQADKNTGLVVGGGLSRGSGAREVDVAAGEAFIDTANGLKHVIWADTTLVVPANTPSAQVYVDNMGVVSVSTFGIDKRYTCLLGEVGTNTSFVTYLLNQAVLLPQFRARLVDYMEDVIGPINVAGGLVTVSGRGFGISASSYFLTELKNDTEEIAAATFYRWQRNGVGGWTVTANETLVDNTVYDDGTGTPHALTDNYYRRDVVYVIKNADYTDVHLVVGQEEFATLVEATTNPIAPDAFSDQACRIAALVIQKAATTMAAIDQRPRLGQMAAASTGVTRHDDLAGRDSPTAHVQYELVSRKNTANGYLGLDENNLAPLDKLPAIPHGNQAGGTLHALVTPSAHGFMDKDDKTKINAINTANLPTTNEKAAMAGTSGTAPSGSNKFVDHADSRLADDRRAIPQGATKSVQYNDSGTSKGSSKAGIDTDENLILSSASHTDVVAVPPANRIKAYGRKRAGRINIECKNPDGFESALQSALFSNKIGLMLPTGNATTVQSIGMATGTATGTATARNVTTTNLLNSLRRIGYVSNNTAGSLAGWREGIAQLFLGNVAKLGGFFIVARIGFTGFPAVGRWFFGLDNATSAPSNSNPYGLNNTIGFGCDGGDTNLKAWAKGSSGIVPIDTGIAAKDNDAVFEFRIYAAPNSQKIGMSVRRLDTDQYWEHEDIGSVTDAPAANVLMGLKTWGTNNSTTGTIGVDLISLYKETDY